MFEKTEVNGENTCEIYKFLRRNSELFHKENHSMTRQIPWNFAKFCCCENGKVMKYFPPTTSPDDMRFFIEDKLLGLEENEYYKNRPTVAMK